jgi:hypothetical protein
MKAEKKCKICRKVFTPDKRHPRQKICSNTQCRKKARLEALRKWRKLYPEYFKNRTDNIEKMREWRRDHPDYYRKYRKAHPGLKKKSREYVRAHRAKKKASLQELMLAKTKSSSIMAPNWL